MRILRHLVSGGLVIASLALGAPAVAGTFYTTTSTVFNWTLTGNDYNNNVGEKLKFDSSVGTGVNKQTITLTASAWNATKATGATNYTFSKATLEQYSGGLAVIGSSSNDSPGTCGLGGCNAHQIDNMGNTANSSSIDFVRLDFSKPVILGGFGQTVYPMLYADESKKNGSYKTQYDDDYSVGVMTPAVNGVTNKTDVVAGLAGVSNLATIFGINDPKTASCTPTGNNTTCSDQATVYTQFQSGSVTASTTWYVAASILSNYGGDGKPDGFKLASLTAYYNVQVPHQAAAPEPSSWMTMILGFGVAGTAIRRARRQKGATASV